MVRGFPAIRPHQRVGLSHGSTQPHRAFAADALVRAPRGRSDKSSTRALGFPSRNGPDLPGGVYLSLGAGPRPARFERHPASRIENGGAGASSRRGAPGLDAIPPGPHFLLVRLKRWIPLGAMRGRYSAFGAAGSKPRARSLPGNSLGALSFFNNHRWRVPFVSMGQPVAGDGGPGALFRPTAMAAWVSAGAATVHADVVVATLAVVPPDVRLGLR